LDTVLLEISILSAISWIVVIICDPFIKQENNSFFIIYNDIVKSNEL